MIGTDLRLNHATASTPFHLTGARRRATVDRRSRGPSPATVDRSILVAGLLLAIWARHHLAGCYWSGEIAIKLDHALVRSGPYALVRHPIYTALLAMYAGSVVVSGEWQPLLGADVGRIGVFA